MRDLPAGMGEHYAGRHVTPIVLAELYFRSETVYMWSGVGSIFYNGNEYLGGGKFIGISEIEETQNVEAKGIVASLNGISSELIAIALAEGQTRGRPFRLFLSYGSQDYIVAESTGIITEDGDTIIAENEDILVAENGEADSGDIITAENGSHLITEEGNVAEPYRIFSGIMDVPEYSTNGATADIRLSIENCLIIGQRAKTSRYTNEDQRKIYPNDRGLEFINQLQDKELVW